MPLPTQPELPAGGAFRTTHWTVVLEAAQANSVSHDEAFTRLYLQYWYPLYAYVRRRGFPPAEAEDVTQDFFTRLVSKQSLSGLQREGGRFRSFLLRAVDNFLANEWDRAHAQKRGEGQHPLSLNVEAGEARLALDLPEAETPATLFERRWAFVLLENVTAQLRAEYAKAGKAELFERLHPHLQGDRSGPPYATIAAQCGPSEGAVKVAVHRMRHRYGELLRQEIARTVSSPEEIDEELRYLIQVVGS
jgi:DNA-directed RNA polymerase specialized sigma24 family protein